MITVDLGKLNLREGRRILDIGCGSGRHTSAVSRFAGVVVIGSDIDLRRLAEVRERIDMEKNYSTFQAKRCDLVASDICSLPFGNECFDLIICSEVLEHVADYVRGISELKRVLKSGGNLVLSVPRYYPEKLCWALSESYSNTSGGHVRVFKTDELRNAVERHGLRCWSMHYAHSLHTPYWWMKCVLGPHKEDVRVVNLYHQFLVWDIMKKPRLTRFFDHLLNPILGKSVVMYFKKVESVSSREP